MPPDYFGQLHDYLLQLRVRGDLRTTRVRQTQDGAVISAPFATTDGQQTGGGSGARVPLLVAKISADNNDGTYNATAQYFDSTLAARFAARTSDQFDFSSGAEGVLYEINGRAGVPIDNMVIVNPIEDDDGGIVWCFDATSDQYGFEGHTTTFGGDGTVGAWVEITGGTGPYSWKQKDPDASTDASPAVTGTSNLNEVNGRLGIPSGSIVWAWFDGTAYRCEYHGADSGTADDLRRTGSTGGSVLSSDWERANQGALRGVQVNFLSGIFADASTDKLYSYYRTIEFDANGHATLIDTERAELSAIIDDITSGGSGTPPSTGIHAHYPFEEGSGTTVADISGNGYDGTANGGMSWSSSPAVGTYAGSFDGSNDYVECPSSADPAPGSGDISVFAWINGTADGYIVSASDGNTNSHVDWQLRISSGSLVAQCGVGSTVKTVTGASVSSGWHSVGFVVTSGTLELWYDNTSQGTVALGGSINNNGQPVGIGAFKGVHDATWAGFFTGQIDDVRIYSQALSNTEVSDIYNKTI